MLHFISGEVVTSNSENASVEESGNLFNGYLEPEFDDPVNHSGVVSIDPESESLISVIQRTQIESGQPPRQTLVSFKRFGKANGPIIHFAAIRIHKLGL